MFHLDTNISSAKNCSDANIFAAFFNSFTHPNTAFSGKVSFLGVGKSGRISKAKVGEDISTILPFFSLIRLCSLLCSALQGRGQAWRRTRLG